MRRISPAHGAEATASAATIPDAAQSAAPKQKKTVHRRTALPIKERVGKTAQKPMRKTEEAEKARKSVICRKSDNDSRDGGTGDICRCLLCRGGEGRSHRRIYFRVSARNIRRSGTSYSFHAPHPCALLEARYGIWTAPFQADVLLCRDSDFFVTAPCYLHCHRFLYGRRKDERAAEGFLSAGYILQGRRCRRRIARHARRARSRRSRSAHFLDTFSRDSRDTFPRVYAGHSMAQNRILYHAWYRKEKSGKA